MAYENMMKLFLGGLRDHIKYEVRLFQPQSLSQAVVMARQVEEKFLASKRQGNINFSERRSLTHSLPQPTRLTPQQIEEKRAKGLCYNCDNKYSRGHKCGEKKLFYIEGPNEEEEEEPVLEGDKDLDEESHDSQPIISCHALSGFSAPQTLKVVGFLKK